MDLRDLRYFETIAELEHIGRATERLHRTQPALTSSVRRLEEACGASLFEKAGRGIRLTPAGKILLKWAQRVRFDVEDARREIGDIGRGLWAAFAWASCQRPGAVHPAASRAAADGRGAGRDLEDRGGPHRHAQAAAAGRGTGPDGRAESPQEPGFTSQRLAEDHIVVAASATHPIFDSPRPRPWRLDEVSMGPAATRCAHPRLA